MPAMSVSPEEVARFDALAASWWDPNGPMRALHRMNPARVQWIVERVGSSGGVGLRPGAARAQDSPSPCGRGLGGGGVCAIWRRPLPPTPSRKGRGSLRPCLPHSQPLDLLDIGCGAGVAAEALARRGFDVLGLDAAGEAIEAARVHATGHDLPLAYRMGTAEDLLAEGLRFPVITALEVIEHVSNPTGLPDHPARPAVPGWATVPLDAEPDAALIRRRQGRGGIPATLAACGHP